MRVCILTDSRVRADVCYTYMSVYTILDRIRVYVHDRTACVHVRKNKFLRECKYIRICCHYVNNDVQSLPILSCLRPRSMACSAVYYVTYSLKTIKFTTQCFKSLSHVNFSMTLCHVGFSRCPSIDYLHQQRILRITVISYLLLANRLNGYRRVQHKIGSAFRSVGLHYVRVGKPHTSIAAHRYCNIALRSPATYIKSPPLLLSKYTICVVPLWKHADAYMCSRMHIGGVCSVWQKCAA